MALSKNGVAFIILIVLFISLISCIYSSIKVKNGSTVYYFYSQGCRHCKEFDSIWDEAIQGVAVKTIKVDVKEPKGQELINQYGIRSVPTVIIVTQKGVVRFMGQRTVEVLREFITKNV